MRRGYTSLAATGDRNEEGTHTLRRDRDLKDIGTQEHAQRDRRKETEGKHRQGRRSGSLRGTAGDRRRQRQTKEETSHTQGKDSRRRCIRERQEHDK